MSVTDDSNSSSTAEEEEPFLDLQANDDDIPPIILLRRQQQSWTYYLAATGARPMRIRRFFIRPLLVLLIGSCLVQVQRRSIANAKDHHHHHQQLFYQEQQQEQEDSWWNPSPPYSSLDFQLENEKHENDSDTSPLDAASHTTITHASTTTSHMRQHAFHLPYFPRHVPSSSSTSAPELEDPETFGWEPSQYPNPTEKPKKCGIAYLLQDQELFHSEELQLCDPDWVLGGIYLEEIAMAMKNFVRAYSSPPPPTRRRRLEEGWVVEENAVADAATTTNTTSQDRDDENPNKSTEDNNIAVVDSDENEAAVDESAPFIELGIATVRKMHVSTVLEHGIYYSYEDEEDMVSDAAQIFARYLHDRWWQGNPNGDYGILIFLSIQDRVCFISTGSAITTVLPWWRLEHIVSSMKPDLRNRDYGHALLTAIHDLSDMLAAGPPTLADRFHDFMARFGVVIAFAIFTFFFGAWGEFRDRRKQWAYAETRSKMSHVEREKARLLQREFKTRSCPICLENYNDGADIEEELAEPTVEDGKGQEDQSETQDRSTLCRYWCSQRPNKKRGEDKSASKSNRLRRVDSYGLPVFGPDHRHIKLLRCGHIFCESCWKGWVHSGQGNPCICPVCRQDVGKSSKHRRRRRQQQQQEADEARRPPSEEAPLFASSTPTNTDTTPFMNNTSTRLSGATTYDSISTYRSSSIIDGVDEEYN